MNKTIKIVDKVWGDEFWLVNTELYCFKILSLKQGYRCSYHYHKIKDETFFIMSGKIKLKVNNKIKILNAGDSIRIFPNTKHSFEGIEESKIIEVSIHHEDNDSYKLNKSGKIK